MAEVTLSKAVRSNLLNLQSTANSLAKTQERLATGLKVNSALDNPTNFFTASSLSSRASDLGRLLDSVSNAKSTIEAADKGISSITKLVESAQATARQALQTSATVENVTAATAGTVNGGTFSAVDLSGTTSAATAGTIDAGTFSAVDLSGTATAGVSSFTFGGSTGAFDGDDAITFDIAVDGGSVQNITIDATAVGAVGNTDSTIDSAAEFVSALNNAITGATATESGGTISITSDTTGATSSIAITNYAVVDTNTSGFTDNTGIANDSDTGTDADSITFSLSVDGGSAQSITIDAAAATAVGNTDSTIDDVDELVSVINNAISGATASNNGGALRIVSDTTGASSSVAISSFSENTTSGATGLADGSDTGAAAETADSITFSLAIDGGSAQSITIDGSAVSAVGNSDTTIDSVDELVTILNSQISGATASNDGGAIQISSDTTGSSSSVAITSFTADVQSGATGLVDGSDTGTAEVVTTSVNPKRDEFVTQYNELLTQIDDLAEDASFNGVNLLDGDSLSVLFNEDGSSSLDITGVTYDSAGLGLSAISSGGFNSNTDINSTLDDLSDGIDTLRTQASTFGSNLSVVEIRQDFTKELINTLETGSANLTLADSNEEAAQLLALQTRQQLSSTALSLASQADQNVLRLF